MLKTSIINNTWSCDNCNIETQSVANPYFQITIQNGGSAICPSSEIDLINLKPFIDYIAIVDALPEG